MATLAVARRELRYNGTLPSVYQNCSVPSLSGDCWSTPHGHVTLVQILYTALRDEQLRNAWTCANIETFCSRTKAQQVSMKLLDQIYVLGDTTTRIRTLSGDLLAPLSIVSNFLLFITLWSRTLDGNIFWYVKCIALAQILQALNRLCHYHWSWNPYQQPGHLGYYVWNGIFSDHVYAGGRVFGTCMSFFMSLDRFVAVCYPLKFDKLVWWKWFVGALVYSIIMASLQLVFVPVEDAFYDLWYHGQLQWIQENVFAPFVGLHGITIILLSFVFSIRIVIILRRRSRKIGTMMSAATVKLEHKKMVFLCQVQILETITLAYDLCYTIVDSFYYFIAEWTTCEWTACSVSYLMPSVVFPVQALFFSSSFMYGFVYTFDGNCHIELFFLYMIFARRIRGASKDVRGVGFRLVKTGMGKMSKCLKFGSDNVVGMY